MTNRSLRVLCELVDGRTITKEDRELANAFLLALRDDHDRRTLQLDELAEWCDHIWRRRDPPLIGVLRRCGRGGRDLRFGWSPIAADVCHGARLSGLITTGCALSRDGETVLTAYEKGAQTE